MGQTQLVLSQQRDVFSQSQQKKTDGVDTAPLLLHYLKGSFTHSRKKDIHSYSTVVDINQPSFSVLCSEVVRYSSLKLVSMIFIIPDSLTMLCLIRYCYTVND